jgi:hypothetical protein
MLPLRSVIGIASLNSIVARHSSARVLDLHSLAASPPDDPDYFERPLFIHPVLNRAIVAKQFVRPEEVGHWASRRIAATKLIMPFDAVDLSLGGQYLFVDETNFLVQLERHLDYGENSMDRDVQVLRLLDKLPTLDPFLLRETLLDHKIEVAPCYFRFSPTDKADMLGFVSHEMDALIALCFDGLSGGGGEKSKRLSELLLADKRDTPELDPLRQTLGMTPEEFGEAMFCWKAVLYYRWRSRTLGPQLRKTKKSISQIGEQKFKSELTPFVRRATRQLEASITSSGREVARALKIYDDAFRGLTVDRSPDHFRHFLFEGAHMFAGLGEQVARLEQIVSFWAHQFPQAQLKTLTPEATLDGLRDLLHAISVAPRVPPIRYPERARRIA